MRTVQTTMPARQRGDDKRRRQRRQLQQQHMPASTTTTAADGRRMKLMHHLHWLHYLLWCGILCAAQATADAFHLKQHYAWQHGDNSNTQPAMTTDTYLQQQQAARQKFILDVLLQVHKPLLNAELLAMGEQLVADPARYRTPLDADLQQFLRTCSRQEYLQPREHYNELNMRHVQQFVGLCKFFIAAHDWPTFQQNVAYARLRFNAVLFVFALNVALQQRADTKTLWMPPLNEVLPQLFYERETILCAESVAWQRLAGDNATLIAPHTHQLLQRVLHAGTFAEKVMPPPMQAADVVLQVANGQTPLMEDTGVHIFWAQMVQQWEWQIVADERRQRGFKKQESGVQNLAEDDAVAESENYSSERAVAQKIIDGDLLIRRVRADGESVTEFAQQSPKTTANIWNEPTGTDAANDGTQIDGIIDGDRLMALTGEWPTAPMATVTDRTSKKSVEMVSSAAHALKRRKRSDTGHFLQQRRDELLLLNLQQLQARFYVERYAQQMDSPRQAAAKVDMPFAVLTTGGVAYQNATHTEDAKAVIAAAVLELKQQLEHMVATVAANAVDVSSWKLLRIMAGIFTRYNNTSDGSLWQQQLQRLNAALYDPNVNRPTLLQLVITQFHADSFRALLQQVTDMLSLYWQQHLPTHTWYTLNFPEVRLLAVAANPLITFDAPADADLGNLLDLQLLHAAPVNHIDMLQNAVLARQMQLNYGAFNISYELSSTHAQFVLVRTFLLPKFGAWREQQLHVIQLDSFVQSLTAGTNRFTRHSSDIMGMTETAEASRRTLHGMYTEAAELQPAVGGCAWPEHLLLPRGTREGLPMQLFVFVAPFSGSDKTLQLQLQAERLCGFWQPIMAYSTQPLRYPFDREILVEDLRLLPNAMLTDIVIQHERAANDEEEAERNS